MIDDKSDFAIVRFALVFKLFAFSLFSRFILNEYLSNDKFDEQLINESETMFVRLIDYLINNFIIFHVFVFEYLMQLKCCLHYRIDSHAFYIRLNRI